MSETINVRVRDHSAESRWGSGPLSPAVRTLTLSAQCPRCGGPRGEAKPTRQHEDGVTYWVDTWSNPCGHVDAYTDVLAEARARGPLETPVYY